MRILINGIVENLTGVAAKEVRRQPGYQPRKCDYALSRTKTGGVRLYANIDGKWMDASLEDMTHPSIVALLT